MPKDAPSVLRIRRVLRQWSHCECEISCQLSSSEWWACLVLRSDLLRTFSFSRASLMGRPGRAAIGALDGVVESAMAADGIWV